MRIRSRLLLLVCAVLLPAIIGAGIGLTYIYREEQDFIRASMQETARALALALDREMARRQALLGAMADAPSLQLEQLERFYGFAAKVANDNDSAIILSDLQGRQMLNTRLPYGTELPRMLPMEREFRARLGNEAVLVSDLYTPPAGLGPLSFAIQVPVRRNGEVVRFLTMASFAAQMQKLLAEQRLPQGWLATVVDRRGIIAARNLEPEKYVGQPVRKEIGAKLAFQAEGLHEGVTLGGIPGTAFWSRAPASSWAFVVTVPHSTLYGPAMRTVALMAALSLLLLGLGAGLALRVARHISQPVEALRGAAQRLGHNEPVREERTGTAELDEVSHAMAEASAKLRNATAELERRIAEAVGSFEQSQRALLQAQKLEALGRLTGGIAHDFNNVLQTLTASMGALKRGASGEQQMLLARCQRAVARGTELARQLMAFGRVQEIRAETIDTAARLAEARHLLAGALPANVKLDYEVADDLWRVTVDPAQLELSLLNLVINSRDAMPPSGGSILLRASNQALGSSGGELAPGDYVAIALSDTGEGMTEEVLAKALDPFYTTKGVGKGSGMGLPQAYGFARQNGGTLALASRRGKGTTVTIYLPRTQEPLTERPLQSLVGLPSGKGKVLLVEDDEQVRETVSSALRAAGFEIRTAATADEALRRIDSGERYDAVLTDVVMPGELSGLDLADELRRRHPRTGVVVATGYTDRAVHLPGVRALPKPYELQQAVDAINAAITG
jgi:signal transduction histidine kinase/CheY-like chemotaxis protein